MTEREIKKRFLENAETFTKNTRETYRRRGMKYLKFCKEKDLDFLNPSSLEKFLIIHGKEDYYRAKRFLEIAGVIIPKKKSFRDYIEEKEVTIIFKDGGTLNGYIIDIETPFLIVRTNKRDITLVNIDSIKQIKIWGRV